MINSPKENFGGWRVCISLAVIVSLGMALVNTFGVVYLSVAADFNLDLAVVGLGMSIFMMMVGLTAPILGKFADKGPVKPIMLGGVVLMVLGVGIMTRTENGYFLAFGMLVASLGIVMHGMVPSNGIITNWFIERRATALAILAVGLAFGGLWLPPAAAWLMENGAVENDWRYALQVLSYILAGIALVVIFFGVTRTPEEVGQNPDGAVNDSTEPQIVSTEKDDESFRLALRSRDLWFTAIAFGMLTMVSLANGTYIVPFLEQNAGVTKIEASLAISVISFASIIGSLSAGIIADKIGSKTVLIISQSIIVLAFLVYLSHPGYITIIIAAAFVGLGIGAFLPMQPNSAGSRFGRAIAGRVIGIYGLMGLPFSLSVIPLAGMLSSRVGTFDIIYQVGILILLLAIVMISVTAFEPESDNA